MSISIEIFLLITSILLFISLVLGKASYKYGVPALLIFILIGMVAGSDGIGIKFNSPYAAQILGVIALNIILFSGGMDTRISEIKPIAWHGIALATLGVLFTALLTGVFIFWISNNFLKSVQFSLLQSLLLASIMSSTDSASVFSILRSKKLTLKENLRPMLELESGSNDPMAYMLISVLMQLLQAPELSGWEVLLTFLKQMIIGVAAGFILGKLSVKIINRINLENDALYSVLLLTVMFFLFGATSFLGGNGYLAVYAGGLLIGNHRFVHKRSTLKFFDGLTWLFQLMMFLALGLLVNPSELIPIAGAGILIGLFMILVSRPTAVFLSLLPFKQMSFKGKAYISWMGLRGAVPIIFATYPWIQSVPQAKMMFNIVFFITIISLLLQGTTAGWMAEKLGLSAPTKERRKLKNFDVEISDDIKSYMSEISIKKEFLANGSRLMDLNIPDKTLIGMVKRDGKFFIPRGNTQLLVGDRILVITDDEKALEETYEQMKGEWKM